MTYKNLSDLAKIKKIVLGSGSPRRVKLLGELGIEFRQTISGIDEPEHDNGHPYEHARELAEKKALSLRDHLGEDEIVIGADTVVVLDGRAMSKPVDESEAILFLKKLSGVKHTVCTALALSDRNGILACSYELTDVYFNEVTDEQISDYVKTGEPLDKAGAYGIQGMGAFLVDRIEGNLDTVIGLPRKLLDRLAGEVCSNIEQKG